MRLTERTGAGIVITVLITVYVLFDTLLDWLFEILHLSFELFELTLDKLVEHIFHTDHHVTQTIVFYLMLLIAGSVLYKMAHLMPGWCRASQTQLALFRKLMEDRLKSQWRSATARSRMTCCALVAVGACLLMLGVLS